MKRYIRRYARNLVVALDQLVSAVFFGDEDETISSRLGKCQRGDHGVLWRRVMNPLRLLVDALAYPFEGWGHCVRAIEEDEGVNAVFTKESGYDAGQGS